MVKVSNPDQKKECINLHGVTEGKTSKVKFDILGNLPREIAFKILINLTREDIDSAVKCCKKWREDMNYELLWKSLYKREYFDFEEEPDTEFYRNKLRKFSSRWQGRYMYNRMFQYNIENNKYVTLPVSLSAPRDKLIHFDDRMLILATDYESNQKVVIVDSSTGLIEKELLFSLHYVEVIKHENLLVAITLNFQLKVWDIDSCKCIINVEMDCNSAVLKAYRLLACKHLILIFGRKDMDSLVYVFNTETQNFSFLGKELYVFCTRDTIAIAENNGIVELLDTNLKSLARFNCFKAMTLIAIRMNHDFLVKAYLNLRNDCYASVWNIKTKTNFRIRIKGYAGWYLKLAGNILVCKTDSERCEVWDLNTQNRRFKIDTKKQIVNIAVLSNRYIFLYFHSLKIEIYHIQKGALIKKCLRHSRHSNLVASTDAKLLQMERKLIQWECKWEILNFECSQD